MSTSRLKLRRPHPGQRKIQAESRRFNVVACGRRFGKTAFGVNRISRPALEGYPVGWFAPNYKYLTEAQRDFIRYLRPVIARASATEKRIELVSGGVIEFWTLDDPDAGRSRKYKYVAIDEAAKARHLEKAWTESIRATLTDFRGSADFYSTPKGRDFFWRAFTWGQDPNQPDWACWQLPTTSNPFIDPAEVEAARKQLPDRVFRQEYLAEFIDDAGGVFRGVREAIIAGLKGNQPAAAPGRSGYFLGVDLARVEDFTVLTVLDADSNQVYHERFKQIAWERQISAITRVAKLFRADVVLDSTGVGDPILERLRNNGLSVLPFHFTNSSKEALINNLAMKLEQGQVKLMDIEVQTNELLAYEYQLTQARNVRMNAPEGMHDDCVIALGLAAWGRGQTYSAGFF